MNNKEAKALDKTQLLDFVNDLRCISCDHYVNGEWTAYDGKMFCQVCWDNQKEEEKRVRQAEIHSLKKRLKELEGEELE